MGPHLIVWRSHTTVLRSYTWVSEGKNRFSEGGFEICKQKVQILLWSVFTTQPCPAKVQGANEFFQRFCLWCQPHGWGWVDPSSEKMITWKRKSSIGCFGHPDEPSESNLGNFETVTQQQYNAGSRIPLRTTAVKQATSLSDPIMEILFGTPERISWQCVGKQVSNFVITPISD